MVKMYVSLCADSLIQRVIVLRSSFIPSTFYRHEDVVLTLNLEMAACSALTQD